MSGPDVSRVLGAGSVTRGPGCLGVGLAPVPWPCPRPSPPPPPYQPRPRPTTRAGFFTVLGTCFPWSPRSPMACADVVMLPFPVLSSRGFNFLFTYDGNLSRGSVAWAPQATLWAGGGRGSSAPPRIRPQLGKGRNPAPRGWASAPRGARVWVEASGLSLAHGGTSPTPGGRVLGSSGPGGRDSGRRTQTHLRSQIEGGRLIS